MEPKFCKKKNVDYSGKVATYLKTGDYNDSIDLFNPPLSDIPAIGLQIQVSCCGHKQKFSALCVILKALFSYNKVEIDQLKAQNQKVFSRLKSLRLGAFRALWNSTTVWDMLALLANLDTFITKLSQLSKGNSSSSPQYFMG